MALWQLLSPSSSPPLSPFGKNPTNIKYIPKFSETLIITNHHAEATPYMCIMGNEGGVTRSNAVVFSLSE